MYPPGIGIGRVFLKLVGRDELELLVEYLGHIPTADPLLRDILQ